MNNLKLITYFEVQEASWTKELQMAGLRNKVESWKTRFMQQPQKKSIHERLNTFKGREERSDTLTFDSKSLQNVNFDYLAIQKSSTYRKGLRKLDTERFLDDKNDQIDEESDNLGDEVYDHVCENKSFAKKDPAI